MRLWPALFLIGLTAPAQAQEAKPRSLAEAIHLAIDLCSTGTQASDGGTVRIAGAFKRYAHVSGGAAASALQRAGIETTAQAPELLHRFAATAAHSRVAGARDFTILGAGDGYVLIIHTAQRNMCDIGVTAIDEQNGLSEAIKAALDSKERWSEVPEQSADTNMMWRQSYSYGLDDNGENVGLILAQGLTDNLARPEGIQAEINFSAKLVEEESPFEGASDPNEIEDSSETGATAPPQQ